MRGPDGAALGLRRGGPWEEEGPAPSSTHTHALRPGGAGGLLVWGPGIRCLSFRGHLGVGTVMSEQAARRAHGGRGHRGGVLSRKPGLGFACEGRLGGLWGLWGVLLSLPGPQGTGAPHTAVRLLREGQRALTHSGPLGSPSPGSRGARRLREIVCS